MHHYPCIYPCICAYTEEVTIGFRLFFLSATISLSQKTKELVCFGLARTDDKPRGEAEFILRLSRGANKEDEVKSHF